MQRTPPSDPHPAEAPPEVSGEPWAGAHETADASSARGEHVSCAVCGRDDARPYKRRMYAVGATRFDLVRCRGCGFVYVDPRPDAEALARMYDDPAYYTEGYNLGVEDQNYFERRDELLTQYDGEVARLEREVRAEGATGGDLFELGAAGGFLLEAARRRGWRVRGVEVSPVAAAYATGELGLDVFRGLLEDAPYEDESFDLAVADNVLEHTTSPRTVLERMRALLRPGGHLLLVVPAYVNSIYMRTLFALGRLVPRRLLGPQLARMLKLDPEEEPGRPYHVLEFDRATLLRLVREAGFEVARCEGSVPLPAHLFKRADLRPHERGLKLAFRALDALMRAGLLPGARLRVLARRPLGDRG